MAVRLTIARAADPTRRRGPKDGIHSCPLDGRRMEGAPANPKLNKVGKGTEEGPELLVAPADA